MSKRQQNHQYQNNNRKQKFQLHLKHVEPITENQEKAFDAYYEGKQLILHGVAGTGKTYIALHLALQDVLKDNYDQIIIIRSSVQARDIGHLPGSVKEKTRIFEEPYREIVNDLAERDDAWEILVSRKKIDFIVTSFLRGLTFNNTIIIFDEIQNCSLPELEAVITRIGENCRIIFSGDYRQQDLKGNTRKDVLTFLDILDIMNKFTRIEFGVEDIVRSDIVKEYIIAKLKYEERRNA